MLAWANREARRAHARDAAARLVLEPLARRAVGEGRDERQRARRSSTCAPTATATRCSAACSPTGPACHTGSRDCWGERRELPGRARAHDRGAPRRRSRASRYVARLLHGPREHAARKVGEEATEVLLAVPGSRRAGRRGRRPLVPRAACCSRATAATRSRRSRCCARATPARGDAVAFGDAAVGPSCAACSRTPARRRCCASGPSACWRGRSRSSRRATSSPPGRRSIARELARELLDALAFVERLDSEEFALVGELALIGEELLPRLVGRARHRRRRVAPDPVVVHRAPRPPLDAPPRRPLGRRGRAGAHLARGPRRG